MSAVARQRSDSSPQKMKAIRQPSFAYAAAGECQNDEDRRKRDEDAARRREERKRLEELQRQKDEEDADEAARRIVDAGSRIARIKLEDQQRQQLLLQQQLTDEASQSHSSPLPATSSPIPSPQLQAATTPTRAGASSPVKKYLRNELRWGLRTVMPFHTIDSTCFQRCRSQKQEHARQLQHRRCSCSYIAFSVEAELRLIDCSMQRLTGE